MALDTFVALGTVYLLCKIEAFPHCFLDVLDKEIPVDTPSYDLVSIVIWGSCDADFHTESCFSQRVND